MNDPNRLQDDLDFVRAAVNRSRDNRGAAAIYWLWAGIVGIGFALGDFRPQWSLWFWTIAGFGGGLLSMWLGYRDDTNRGVRDEALGRRQGWHWLLCSIAMGLVTGAIALGRIPPQHGSAVLLAVTGLSYALAGIHMNAPMRWPGFAMLAGSIWMLLWPMPWQWTVTGVVVAAALIAAGIFAAREPRA